MNRPSSLVLWATRALLALTLLYAALAGLRTITDPDTGWQLATGRYIAQHRSIPSTDVLSYTAQGQQWIYPPLAEWLLYVLYGLGGFAALSWLNSLACTATAAIALSAEGSLAAILLAILAIPRIASRTAPRADLFTTVLFAALLAVLWRYFRGRSSPLWLIPILLLIWVNVHPGFIAGIALLAAYIVLELAEFLFPERRSAATARLRRAVPWLAAALPATLCNPWGWKIYATIFRQEQVQGVHENLIAEWSHTPLSLQTLSQALQWRNPNSSYWWLLAATAIAAVIALKRKQFASAALLAAFGYLSLRNLRFQALFAVVAVVVASPFLTGWFKPREANAASSNRSKAKKKRAERAEEDKSESALAASWPAFAFITICTVLLAVRSYDLISEHAYIAAGEPALFGAGISSWFPQRAADFVLREHLPGNIFHEYNMGGYLAFRLGPQYLDYIDGRAIPFGDLMFEQRKVMKQPPDSPIWQQEADHWGINVLIFNLARYWGLGSTRVQQFCSSQAWKPVYLDEEGAVFLRNRPENTALIERLQIDCQKVQFDPPAALAADSSSRGRAERFNFYANAGSILYKLGRNTEAAANLDRALEMFPEEPYLHHTRGQVYEAAKQLPQAEHEYLISSELAPTEANWLSLASLYRSQHRSADAINAVEQAAALSVHPAGVYVYLGQLHLAMNQPQDSLAALDTALENSSAEPPDSKVEIEAQVAEGKARVWAQLGDLHRAVGFQQQALSYEPSNPQRWTTLAEIYAAQGQSALEQDARQHAQALRQTNP
ncbi:MAG: tetratricopeptide repeat protein [Candidatus Sulfotelmatobacter sp.]